MKKSILVIGGVAAGPSAAAKAKRVDPDSDVILFEQGEHISYGICEIPYFIGNVIPDAKHLQAYSPARLLKEKGVVAHVLRRVEEIDPSKRTIVVRNLERSRVEEYTYHRLIIATGSRPKPLRLVGENAPNVFHVKSLSEAFALKKYVTEERIGSALIIGGGYIGLEMAEALVGLGLKTTMVHPSDLPLMGLERPTRVAILDQLTGHGVVFIPNQEVRSLVLGASGRVTEVITNERRITTDVVIVSIGVEPNSELAREAGIRVGTHKGILTDQRQVTSIDTIYAAGDCCEVKNIVNGKWMYIPLATTASKQGWVAGENAAGGSAAFKGVIRAIGVKVFELEVAQVGLSVEEAEESGFTIVKEEIIANSRVGFFPGTTRVHIVSIADKRSGRLLGANVFGQEGAVLRANTIGVAIQQKMTLDEISRLDLIYTPPYAPLWDPILISAHQLKKRLNEKGRSAK
jgi:NADPH-dependent 2,4-dienoyl-CoA reductase/sulfur reductase-like enzyme